MENEVTERLIACVRAYLKCTTQEDANGLAFLPYEEMVKALKEYDEMKQR